MAVGIGTPIDTETETGVGIQVSERSAGGGAKREVVTSENEWQWLYWRKTVPSQWIRDEDLKGFLKMIATTTSAGAAILLRVRHSRNRGTCIQARGMSLTWMKKAMS